jgi:hypothetical protein
MATVTLVSSVVLCNTPFLLRRVTLTGGATAAAITHGEDRAPDMVLPVVADGSTPTVTTIGVDRATSATTMTVDCLGDAGDTLELYCVWLNAASGGLNPP